MTLGPTLLRRAEIGCTLLGSALLGAFVWALVERLDLWEVRGFVLLFYGVGGALILATTSSVLLHRQPGKPSPRTLIGLRRAVWVAWMIGALWSWVPSSRSVVAYALRQLSVLCLH
jgi:hypothetical protein